MCNELCSSIIKLLKMEAIIVYLLSEYIFFFSTEAKILCFCWKHFNVLREWAGTLFLVFPRDFEFHQFSKKIFEIFEMFPKFLTQTNHSHRNLNRITGSPCVSKSQGSVFVALGPCWSFFSVSSQNWSFFSIMSCVFCLLYYLTIYIGSQRRTWCSWDIHIILPLSKSFPPGLIKEYIYNWNGEIYLKTQETSPENSIIYLCRLNVVLHKSATDKPSL